MRKLLADWRGPAFEFLVVGLPGELHQRKKALSTVESAASIEGGTSGV